MSAGSEELNYKHPWLLDHTSSAPPVYIWLLSVHHMLCHYCSFLITRVYPSSLHASLKLSAAQIPQSTCHQLKRCRLSHSHGKCRYWQDTLHTRACACDNCKVSWPSLYHKLGLLFSEAKQYFQLYTTYHMWPGLRKQVLSAHSTTGIHSLISPLPNMVTNWNLQHLQYYAWSHISQTLVLVAFIQAELCILKFLELNVQIRPVFADSVSYY